MQEYSVDVSRSIQIASDPVAWAQYILNFNPDEAQSVILRAVDKPGVRIVVESCNGAGKTTIAAVALLRHLAKYHPAKVITMSGGERQVKTQLWSEIRLRARELLNIYRDWNVLDDSAAIKTSDPEHFAIGFSAEDPGRVEGWHSRNLMFIVDEAKSIKEKIWDAIDSTLTHTRAKLLILTVPGTPEDREHKKAQLPGVMHIRIIPRQCADKVPRASNILYSDRIPDAWINEMAVQYGTESSIYKRRVLAIASQHIESSYFPEHAIKAMFNRYEKDGIATGLSIDWGKRQDYAVIIEWTDKNMCRILWRGKEDYMQVVGRIQQAHALKRYKWIIADEGEGRGQIDRMKELGMPVIPFNFGSSIDGAPAKLMIMSLLHTALETGAIGMEYTADAEREFNAFTAYPTSEGRMKFEAAKGYHDDIVCAVAMGYYQLRRGTTYNRFYKSATGRCNI